MTVEIENYNLIRREDEISKQLYYIETNCSFVENKLNMLKYQHNSPTDTLDLLIMNKTLFDTLQLIYSLYLKLDNNSYFTKMYDKYKNLSILFACKIVNYKEKKFDVEDYNTTKRRMTKTFNIYQELCENIKIYDERLEPYFSENNNIEVN